MVWPAAASATTTKGKCRAIIVVLFALSETDPLTMHYVLHDRHREFLPKALPICSTRLFEMMKEIIADGNASCEVCPLGPIVANGVVFGGAIRLLHLALDGVLDCINGHMQFSPLIFGSFVGFDGIY